MTSGEPRVDGRYVTGSKHQRADKPCQDALHYARRAGVVALAVSDGHGSSPNGREGAWLAVDVAVQWLLDFYDELEASHRAQPFTVRELVREHIVRKMVLEWARRVRESAGPAPEGRDILRDHGATLLTALVAPEFILLMQLGDGDILVVHEDGRVVRGVEKSPRNFADETDSLCLPQAWLTARVQVWPRSAGELLILLATDGCANSYESTEAFERIGPDYLSWVRQSGMEGVMAELEAILEETTKQGSGDDIALGMIHIPSQSLTATELAGTG